MNKIFKVIWSKSKQCYIVVSEIAKNKTGKKKIVVAGIFAALAMVNGGQATFAAWPAGGEGAQSAFWMGRSSSATGQNAQAIGVAANASSAKSVAIGSDSVAQGEAVGNNVTGATAVGGHASAIGTGAVALGYRTHGDTVYATAIGSDSSVTGQYGVGLGWKANVSADNSIAVGEQSKAVKEGSTVMGPAARGYGKGSLSIGYQALAGANVYTGAANDPSPFSDTATTINNYAQWGDAAIGLRAVATGGNATALGRSASATAANAIAIGGGNGSDANNNTEKTEATGEKSTAIGYNAKAVTGNDTAIGAGVTASGGASTMIGYTSTVTGNQAFGGGSGLSVAGGGSVGLGYNSSTTSDKSIAIGHTTKSNGTGSIAIGASASATDDNSVAIGSSNTTAYRGGVALGRNAKAENTAINNVAVGIDVTAGANTNGKSDGEAVAVGRNAKANSYRTVAIGSDVSASGSTAVAMGRSANVSNNYGVAVGARVEAGNYGVALGYQAKSTASGALAIGAGNDDTKGMTTATTASGGNSVAIGASAKASKANSVALGSNSTTDKDATEQKNTTINGITYNFAGATSDTGMQVSVGAAGKERQIKNVASGEVSATSTDAINGSQLFAVASQIKPIQYFSVNSSDAGNKDNSGAKAGGSIAIGPNATSEGANSISLGNGSKTAKDQNSAIAIGYSAEANGFATVAIGSGDNNTTPKTVAGGMGSTAIGGGATTSTNMYQTALGYRAKTGAESATAIGDGANASGAQAIAVGKNSQASGSSALALGSSVQSSGTSAVAIGNGSQALFENVVSIGNSANAQAKNASYSIGIGFGAGMQSDGNTNVAIGRDAGRVLTGNNNISIGNSAGNSKIFTSNSVMLGPKAQVSDSNATKKIDAVVVIGNEASASVSGGVAIGSGSKATIDKGVKGYDPNENRTNKYAGLTNNILTSTNAAVSVGEGASVTRQITGVAAGTNNTDAVNVAQLKSVNLAFSGNNTGTTGDVNLATGTLAIKGDTTYITTTANANGITIAGKTQDISVNANGVASANKGMADAKNVAQSINDAISKNAYTWTVSANGDAGESVAKGNTVDFTGDSNITVDRTGKKITTKLNKDITVDSVKANNKVTVGTATKQLVLDGTTGAMTAGTGTNAIKLDGTSATITAGSGSNAISLNGTNAQAAFGSGTNAVSINGTTGSVTGKAFTAGSTTINTTGLTSGTGSSAVLFGTNGISAGNQAIKNVSTGGSTDSNAANIGDVKRYVSGATLNLTDGANNKGSVQLGDQSLKVTAGTGLRATVSGQTVNIGLTTDAQNAISSGIGLLGNVGNTGIKQLKDGNATFDIKGDGSVVKTTASSSGVTIAVDTDKLAANTNLAYTANGASTTKNVALSKGLNFVNGSNTIAIVNDDGKVSFDLNAATKNQINTNTTGVAANKANIATNAADIATNKNKIAANTTDIATNKGKIATNTTNIAANTTALARNISLGADSGAKSSQSLSTTDVAFNVKGATGDFISTKMNGNTVEVSTKRAQIDSDANSGAASVTGADGLATAKNVADAINHAVTKSAYEWKLSANGEATTATVGKGDTVDFTGGSNITVERDNKNISVKLNKNLTNLSSVSIGNNIGETIKLDGSNGGITADHADFKDNTGAGTSIDSSGIKINNGIADLTHIGMGSISLDNGSGGNTVVTSSSVSLTDGSNLSEYNAKGIAFGDTTGTNTAQFGLEGISAANQQIKDVAAGTDDTDAVNVKQLKDTVGDQKLSISDGTKDSTVALKNQKLTVTGTGAAKATVNGQTITIDVAEGTLTPNTTNGTVTGTTGVAKATEVAAAINNTNTVLGNKIATNTTNIAHTIALADDAGTSTTAKSLKDGNVSFNIKGDNKFISTAASGNDVTLTVNEQAIKDAAKAASSFKVKANTHAEEEVKGGDTITFNNGDNIAISQTGKTFTIGTAKNITVDSVTAGNTVINTSGLTNGTTAITGTGITTDKVTVGGISIDKTAGINAGGKVISNVASGTVNNNATDDSNAANIGDVKQAVANLSQNLNITDGTNNGTVDLKNQKLNVAGANGVTTTVNNQTITVGLDANTVNATTKGIGLTADTGSTGNKYLKDGDVSFAVTGDGNLVSTSATTAGVKVAVDAAKVKDLAVSAVTVSKDAQADNPITVTPTAGANSKDYAIGIDTTKLAAKTDLTYRANSAADANAKKISLSKGLNFVDGGSTIATVDNDGKVSFDLNTATKNQITTNTTDIAANKGKIATNTTNIAANTTALARNISLGADTGTASSQSLSTADVAFNVKGATGDFVSTNMNGNTVEISTKRATINSNATTGEASVTGNDGLATAQNVADAINKAADAAKAGAAWNITTNSSTTDKTAVKGGDTVDLVNGDNIEITQDGTDKKKITVATKKDITVDSVTANNKVTVGSGANKITLDGTDGSVTGKAFTGTTFTGTSFTGTSFTAGNTVINTNGLTNGTTAITGTGVTTDNVTVGGISVDKTDGINAGGKVISNVASGGTTLTNAANIGDVQNAVANLSKNLNITDGTHDGTVDLKNQKLNVAGANGVTATVKDQTITVGLDANTVNATTKGIGLTADTGSTGNKYLKDGDVSFAVTGDGSLVSTSATAAGVKVAVNSATITAGTDGTITGPTTDGVATAKNVADAINVAKKASKTEITANTGEAANATTGNVTLTSTTAADGHTIYDVKLNDKVTLGSGANAVTVDGTTGAITGKTATIGGVTVNGTANTIGGLSNTTWNGTAVSGRAATEDQLKAATGATTLKFTGDVAANTGSVNLKDDTFGIKGDNKYISTDVNGKNVNLTVSEAEVKKSAVAAVTVSTDTTDTNNPLTVTPTTSADGTTKDYKVTIDGTKIANKTNLSYKANDGTAKQVSLADGLNFKNGTLTTASIDDKGIVKYDVNTASITAGADGTITGPTTDGVATAKNVADAINAAKKASKTEITANTGEAANATTGNVTLTSTTAADGHTIYDVKLNDKVILGTGANAVTIDGTAGKATIGSSVVDGVNNTFTTGGANAVKLDGVAGTIKTGTVTVTGGTTNDITGLSNTTVTAADFATKGRAATEEQLKAVGEQTWQITADKDATTSGAQTGTKKDAKVGKDDKVQLIAGENLTVNQNERDFTYSLNKDLVKMNSATFEATGGKTTVIKGDSIVQTDGANVNTSNATSNTITDGTNTSTITAGKAQIGTVGIDGVVSKISTGGTNAVVVNGADGTIKTGNVTVTGGTTNDITGLSNTTLSATDFATKGRAATEEQLKAATGATTLKFTGDVATNTGSVNLKDDTFGIKGDGQYISTDVNGKNVNLTVSEAEVKKSAVAAVTVSTDTMDANNPLTVTPTTSADGTTKDYKVTIDGTKIANKTNLSYKANDGTAKQVSLADGLNFKNGTLTTASIDDNGVVKYDVNTASITAGTDGTITGPATDGVATAKNVADAINAAKKASKTEITANTGEAANATTGNVTLTSTTAADGHTIYDVKLNDKVTLGSGANAVTIDGTTGAITGKTATIGGVTVNGTANTIGGLSNTTWNGTAVSGRAATEDQLKAATGATTLKFTGDVAANTGSVNLKDDTFGIKGDNKYISTDVNGKNVNLTVSEAEVKKSAVAAVTVSTDTTDTNNPLTVTPTTSADGTTKDYKVTIDGTKIANKTNLSYKANDGTAKQVSLADGLNFKNGTLTTASIDDKGVVKYDVNTASITAGADGTITGPTTDGVATAQNVADAINAAKKASKTEITANTGEAANATTGNVTLTSTTAADGHTIYDVKLNDKVTLGTGANAVTVDGTAAKVTAGVTTVDGATGTITTGGTNSIKVDGATGTVTGLTNKDWTPGVTKAVTGRAATEDQLQKVADAASSQTWNITADKAGTTGAQTGTKKNATVGKDETVELVAGDNLTINQDERKFTYSLNKDLAGLTSVSIGTGTTETIKLDGATGKITAKNAAIGGVTIDGDNNHVTGLANTTWNGTATTGRAATEDQLKAVAETAKTTTDAVNLKFSGNTNTSPGVVNLKDDTLGIVGDGKYVSTDANGKNLTVKVSEAEVKKSAVAAVTVSTDTTDANNPLTVTPTTSADGTTKDYKVTIDGTKIANKTNLSYKANDGTAKQVSLADGLNFKNGTLTTASIDDNGVVKYDVNTASITAGADGTITGPTTDGVATAKNVADAINAAKKASKTEITANTGEAANATTGNVTLTSTTAADGHTIYDVKLNDKVTLGSGANAVTIDGTAGKATIGTSIVDGANNTFTTGGASPVTLNGATGTITGTTANIGGVTVNGTANTIGGLSNTTWNGTATTGRAATEDQLKAVADAAGSQTWEITADKKAGTSGAQTGTKENAKVGKDDKVSLIAGENLTVDQVGKNFTYSLNTDLVKMNSATFLGTGTNTTVITGDSITQTAGTQTNTSTAAGNTVANGTKSTETTADGQVIKDGTKINTSTVDENTIVDGARSNKTTVDSNVIDDGNGNVNTSNATSNTITDGTNTSTITAGKATIGSSVIDGVNNTFTTGGANAVKLDGAAGIIKTGTVTVTGGTTNDITGLSNTTLSATDFATKGRAATEEQLKAATGATTLKFTGDVATNTGSVNLKDDTFGIKGDGKYISTDVNGKNVNLTVSEAEVKKSAVAAVTVSTDTTDANNPISVTPTTSADGTTKDYKVTIDGTKIANKTNLSYKANGGTAKQVSLADGLNFKNGTLTTASIDDAGVVKYDVNTASITAGADGTITGPTTDGVATAKNVADAINAAKKASKTEITANTGEAANATTGNVTLTSTTAADGHTIYDVKLNDKVTLGSGANAVTIDGTAGKATIGSSIVDGVNNTFTTGGASPVTLNGATGTITGKTANIGGVTVDGTNNHVMGLANKDWTPGVTQAVSGRAATEDQLQKVSDAVGAGWKVNTGKVTGSTGESNGAASTKVASGEEVQFQAGNNLVVDQNGKTVAYSLNKALKDLESATFNGTGTNKTVINGDSITQTAGTQTNTSTAGGNTVADGTKSTETTVDGQVIKDGAKSNKSTVDSNVIDDGNGKVNTSNATSNTITDGTNTTATTSSSVTVKDNAGNSTVITKDNITTGVGGNKITLDGTAGKATVGASVIDGVNNTFTTGGANAVKLDGTAGTIKTGTVTVTGGTTNDITGLSNTTVTAADFATKGRAATEEQLKAVGEQTWQITADKDATTSGAQTGTKKDAKVGKDDKVQLIAGENMTVNQNERDFTFTLNKDLVKMNSATFLGTGTNTTVITGDSITQTAGTQTNTSTAAGNTVADGTKSTETTAAGQVIKDGAKSNKSTVSSNVIDDGTGNVNTSNATSNTITDGTNTSTITAGKATIGSSIVDGVNNTFTTGGANAVKLDGVAGTIKTGTVTVTGGTTNDITGLSNTTVTAADFATKGRAATEEQLKAVGEQTWKITADKDTATSGDQTGTKKDAKVGKDDKVQLIAGENMTVNQNERDFTFTLNKNLVKINSATFLGTGTNKTVITGDFITQTAGTQTNTSTAAGNTVADGTKSTETTAAGQVIKDGAKTNTSTVDENTLVDGAKSNKTTVDSNVIDDGTNTSTITAGKATIGSSIIDGVNNTFITGGASPVTLNGATGTITGKTANIGGVTVDGTNNHVMGLANKDWTPGVTQAVSGRAATEDQLQKVSDAVGAGWKVNTGKVTGSTGESNGAASTKVASGEEVQFQAGNNLIVDQNGKTVAYSLNKALKDLESATFNGTGTNKTVITGDSITQTAGTQTNTSTAGGNTVADGTKSTETTAAGQVIKDGTKTNTSTVDENTIVDGTKSNKSTVDGNTITDGTNTTVTTSSSVTVKDNAGNSTVITKDNITTGVGGNKIILDGTAGKATIGSSIVDGVNNTFTTGGANAVKLDGAAGTIKTGTVTVTGGTTNDITGLSNTTVTGADFATKGRAATEEQLKVVGEQTWQITADKNATTSGAQTGTKKDAKVGKDDKVQLIAGENMTVNQNERDFTFTLNKDLVKMNSATFEATGGKTTVIKGDSIVQTDGTKVNTSTAGGNTVVDGTKSTATIADGTTVTSANGNTKYAADGVRINTTGKNPVSLTDVGLDNGNNVIKNVASGHVNNDATDNTNAANIADVKKATTTVTANAGEAANATKGNVTLTSTTAADGHTIYDVKLNDKVTLGTGANVITIDGTAGKATVGSSVIDGVNNTFTTGGANAVKLDGAAGTIRTGTVTVTGGTTNDITGLSNTTVTSADFATKGRAATEEQLKAVGEQTWQITADKDATTSGAQTGTKKDAKVGKDDKVQLIAGENMTVNQNERDFTFTLNKDLVKMNSATFLGTGSNKTVITGDSITQTAGTQTNTSTAGGNTVADGTKSTETTAAGQVIKDGTKTNTSTVDENTIVDGTKSNKSTVDGNTITDGTNTTETTSSSITVKDNAGNSTVITKDNITTGVGANKVTLDGTAGKATFGSSVVDGVNNTFTTGGANAVKLDGAAGTIKTGTVTVTGGTTNDITGLSNTTVNSADFATKGRAATEEQLKAVGEQTWQITADKDATTSGAQTGTKKDAKVGKDDKVQLIAGENMTVNQNERDFTFTLNKDLVKMNSATFLGTGSNTTVITGKSITQTAGTQTNTSTAAGNTIANGTKSTETTADGQVIKDGAKSNKSTVDSNVIDDGNGNVNTSNATSNTITDGTNTSTITAGKANIGNIAVDGVNNKITMGTGANPVTLDGANGHLDGLTNTIWVPGVTKATTGRAATEDQLQQVSDAVGAGWKVNTGTVAGSSGVSNGAASTKVSSGEEVKLQAGDNLVIDQNGKTVSYSLNKDLTKMNSATFEATGGKTTVIKGDSIVQTDGGKTNTSNAAGNTVVDGNKSTATTAAGTTITDGAKTNTSTADKNVINDGAGNTNVSNATSNTLKNAAGDETKADAKGVTVKDAAGNNATFTKDGITITKTGKDTVSLTSDGLDNGKNKIVNVAAGVANTDAVNVGQLKEYAAKSTTELTANNGETAGSTKGNIVLTKTTAADGHTIYDNKLNDKITLGTDPTKAVTVDGTTGTVTGLTNKTWTPGSIVSGRAATEDQLKEAVADSGWKAAVDKEGSGQSTVVGTSPEKIKAEETVTFKAGNNMMVTQTGKSISYAVNPELTDMKSATFKDAAGNTTVTNGNGITITPGSANPTNPHAGPVSLTKDGLNNGNNQIKGVAPGTDPTDAVNVSQLNASNANTSQAINQIAGEVQHVGAHAAAMAALKPIQYDPLEPTQVMAGVGNYRGETAAALGLAHYTNENTMFNVGVSVGGNHNMVNAGVTHKFGYSPEKKNIPDRYKAGPISSVYVMQDEVSSLKKENAEQKYVIADQAARLTTLEAENEQQRRELAETKKGLDDLKAAVDKLLASKG